MIVGVPKETAEGERRVALTPNAVSRLVNGGIEVAVESGAGDGSFFSDAEYLEAGATTVPSAFESADLVVAVRKPDDVTSLSPGAVLAAMIQPLVDHAAVTSIAEAGVTSFSLDAIPRIARAQSMDVLSSMASLAGYKAAIIAADALGKLFPMMMAASGTTPPAKGLVLGAGVAGLQAIATARRLGAVLSGYDVRPVVREQVESLGATFLEIELDEDAEDAGGLRARVVRGGASQGPGTGPLRRAGHGLCHYHGGYSRTCGPANHRRRDGARHASRSRHRRSRRGDGRQLRVDKAGRNGRRERRDHQSGH